MALIPPFRFSCVEYNLYRGSYPTLKNFSFLRRLQLRTIISITPEPPTVDLLEFCQHEGIESAHFKADKATDHVTLDPVTVAQTLRILINVENEPIYIHCLDGGNITGVVLMVLRRLQNWNLSAITAEFCRFTHDHTIDKEETLFVTNFSEDIVVPLKIPRWLWQGVRITKHPTLRLKHDPPLPNDTTREATSTDSQNQRSDKIGDLSSRLVATRLDLDVQSEEAIDEIEDETSGADISRSLHALDLEGLDSSVSVRKLRREAMFLANLWTRNRSGSLSSALQI